MLSPPSATNSKTTVPWAPFGLLRQPINGASKISPDTTCTLEPWKFPFKYLFFEMVLPLMLKKKQNKNKKKPHQGWGIDPSLWSLKYSKYPQKNSQPRILKMDLHLLLTNRVIVRCFHGTVSYTQLHKKSEAGVYGRFTPSKSQTINPPLLCTPTSFKMHTHHLRTATSTNNFYMYKKDLNHIEKIHHYPTY